MIRTLGARLMAAVIGLGPTPEPAAWALRFLSLGAAGARLRARGREGHGALNAAGG